MAVRVRDVDLADIDALAALLKGRRAQQAFQKALKKGQSPALSLTAAISASLVSAAAKENVEDPLSGLAAVDDLSGLGEDCLPGEKYAEADHDHDGRVEFAHALHGASYRDDPFASRLAGRFAADHGAHEVVDAAGGEHCEAVTLTSGQHPASHAAGATAHAFHQDHGSHEGGHDGDHHVAGLQHAGAGHEEMAANGASHASHDGAAPDADHSAHLSGHEQHAASNLDGHGQHEAPITGGHEEHIPSDIDLPDDDAALEDLADALPEIDNDTGGIPSHHAPAVEEIAAAPASAEDAEDHHASLADMDLPPAEDLSSGGHNHAVL